GLRVRVCALPGRLHALRDPRAVPVVHGDLDGHGRHVLRAPRPPRRERRSAAAGSARGRAAPPRGAVAAVVPAGDRAVRRGAPPLGGAVAAVVPAGDRGDRRGVPPPGADDARPRLNPARAGLPALRPFLPSGWLSPLRTVSMTVPAMPA